MGEVDVIKAIQLLPGVQATSEGASGFSVRGGNPDQNLILLDEATVYNASHLMGFFSVFNNDAIKDVKLYKGDIPAEYGGRLSSLLDVRMKDGNMKKFSGSGGIGTIASRLTLEIPVIKNKTSVLVAGRRTYADLFLLFAKDHRGRSSRTPGSQRGGTEFQARSSGQFIAYRNTREKSCAKTSQDKGLDER